MAIAVATALTRARVDADEPRRVRDPRPSPGWRGRAACGRGTAAARRAARRRRRRSAAASLPSEMSSLSVAAVVGEVADVRRERARVGAERLEQQIVDHDREAEGREDRHQQAAARAALEHEPLQRQPSTAISGRTTRRGRGTARCRSGRRARTARRPPAPPGCHARG